MLVNSSSLPGVTPSLHVKSNMSGYAEFEGCSSVCCKNSNLFATLTYGSSSLDCSRAAKNLRPGIIGPLTDAKTVWWPYEKPSPNRADSPAPLPSVCKENDPLKLSVPVFSDLFTTPEFAPLTSASYPPT